MSAAPVAHSRRPRFISANPKLEQLRQLVAGARLAELEVNFTKEKSRVDVMQAVLFWQLRAHYQQRDRLRLIVDYRRKFLDSLDGTTDFTDDTDNAGKRQRAGSTAG